MDAGAVLTPIVDSLFCPDDMRDLVRLMVSYSRVVNYNLTLSMGGIELVLSNTVKNNQEIHSELSGAGWTVVSTATMDDGTLVYGKDGFMLRGDSRRFETDIIYLKMALK